MKTLSCSDVCLRDTWDLIPHDESLPVLIFNQKKYTTRDNERNSTWRAQSLQVPRRNYTILFWTILFWINSGEGSKLICQKEKLDARTISVIEAARTFAKFARKKKR